MKLRIGTRSSALALRQSESVAVALRAAGHDVHLVEITVPGDQTSDPLPGRAQEGIFTNAISEAVAEGRVDAAIHSCKDLPVASHPSTAIVAMPRREDPRDALVGARLAQLPAGAIIGTCSARRAAWVARVRPDLDIRSIRGPIDLRIARVASGDFDAIILAVAGMRRLGADAAIAEIIPVTSLLPAPAQGALAIEARRDDADVRTALRSIDHASTRLAAIAERAVLAAIDPTDSLPLGTIAAVRDGRLHLRAGLDGRPHHVECAPLVGEREATALGARVAAALLPTLAAA